MNILVTGGNGLLGSNLINYLSRKKKQQNICTGQAKKKSKK